MAKRYGMKSGAGTRSGPKKSSTRMRAKAGTPLTGARAKKVRDAEKLLGRTSGINVTKRPNNKKPVTSGLSKDLKKELKPLLKAKKKKAISAAQKTLKRYKQIYGK